MSETLKPRQQHKYASTQVLKYSSTQESCITILRKLTRRRGVAKTRRRKATIMNPGKNRLIFCDFALSVEFSSEIQQKRENVRTSRGFVTPQDSIFLDNSSLRRCAFAPPR